MPKIVNWDQIELDAVASVIDDCVLVSVFVCV